MGGAEAPFGGGAGGARGTSGAAGASAAAAAAAASSSLVAARKRLLRGSAVEFGAKSIALAIWRHSRH